MGHFIGLHGIQASISMNFSVENCGDGLSFAQTLGTRNTQQDNFGFICDDKYVFIVLADGMGGHEAGEDASRLVVDSFLSTIESEIGENEDSNEVLLLALLRANNSIASYIAKNLVEGGMGSTVVGVYLNAEGVQWISVGDTHLYRYRNNVLKKLNADHSMMPLIMKLVADNKLKESDVHLHPLRNTLISSIIGAEIKLIDSSNEPIGMESNDIYLVCTDGLDVLAEQDLSNCLRDNSAASSTNICRSIMNLVAMREHFDQDNTSLVIFKAT